MPLKVIKAPAGTERGDFPYSYAFYDDDGGQKSVKELLDRAANRPFDLKYWRANFADSTRKGRTTTAYLLLYWSEETHNEFGEICP